MIFRLFVVCIASLISIYSFGLEKSGEVAHSKNQKLDRLGEKINTLNRSQADTFLYYANLYDSLAQKTDDSFYIGNGYLYLGTALDFFNLYDSSLYYFKMAFHVFKNSDDSALLANSHNKMGLIHWRLGNLVESSENQLKALKIQQKINDEEGSAYSLNFLGMLTRQLGHIEESMRFYRKALKLRKSQKDSFNMAATFNNLGNAMRSFEKYDSSIIFIRKALRIQEKLKDHSGLIGSYQSLATVFFTIENYDSAYFYYLKSYNQVKQTKDVYKTSVATYNLGNVLYMKGDLDLSVIYFLESKQLSESIKDIEGVQYAHEGMFNAYKNKGEYKKALFHFRRFRDIKDSISGEKTIQRVAELEKEFESDRKDYKIELLKRQDEIKNLEIEKKEGTISKQRGLIIISIILLVLMLIGGFSLWQLARQKHTNKIQKLAILKQRELLENTVVSQEEERKRIAKELHDGIAQTLSALKLAFDFLKDKVQFNNAEMQGKYIDSLQVLDDACSEIRSISHQMMPRVLIENGLISAMEDMLYRSFTNTSINYTYEHFGFEKGRLSESIEISLYRISQELVNNIIKHSEASNVALQLIRNKEQVILMVEDNGKGLEGKNSDGIGLMNIKSRTDTLNGKVNFESIEGSGLVATIRVPLHYTK